MYMKKYIFLAASALTLASCSSDDFLGDTPGSTPTSANSAIKFDGNAGKISRATSNTATTTEGKLDYQFKIYGVKKTADNKYSEVFGNYSIWWNTTLTTSNTKSWEYVGKKDNSINIPNTQTTIDLEKDQTIKYWDYTSDNYHFVAGSPINEFTYNIDETTKDIKSAKVSGLGGHINANKKTDTNYASEPTPVYVAEPIIVEQAAYKKEVKFNFVRQQTKVRVGIYETIPGYSISSIKFYEYAEGATDLTVSNNNNIILTSNADKYFSGSSDITTKNSGTITYNWTKPEYTFTYDKTNLTESKNWYGGELAAGVKATTSNHTNIDELYGTDADMESNGYFTVLPTPSTTEAKPILIKCDYTLESIDGSEETIEVKGATAAIPAAYSKWNTNTLYTYLFKISENTNGYTGNDPSKTGLYPITFDAAVEAPQFGMEGTITTFTTPSITTYQEGSVTDNGIEYKSGKPITVKVTNPTNGTDLSLTETDNTVGKVAVYKLTKERTEADLQLASVTNIEIITENKQTITLGEESKSFTFTPSATAETTVEATNYYAIQYLTTVASTENNTPAAYTYKVVKVVTPATTTE